MDNGQEIVKGRVLLMRISAQDAYHQTLEHHEEQYWNQLYRTYDGIRDAIELGTHKVTFYYYERYIAERIFGELTVQGYHVYLRHDKLKRRWELVASWEDTNSNSKTKYLLPLDKTDWGGMGRAYAYKVDDGNWRITYADQLDEKAEFTVTAEDLKDAPTWVKDLKPKRADGSAYDD